jgi:hypothetical protein
MIAVCKEIANAHNAALAAEREKHERTLAILDKATEQLRSQLAAAQAAIQRHKRAYGHTLDFPDDTTALDAAITEAYDHARKEADRDWTDVLEAKIAAAQQPLVDALKFYADQENYVNDVLGLPDGSSEVEGSSEINQDGGMKASDALANAGKQ